MPTLRILTNTAVPVERRMELLTQCSRSVATMLGKPESYVMVILEDGRDLMFAGTTEPAAYLELKSLGLPETRTAEYSRTLCDLLTEAFSIPAGRVYVEFADAQRHMWGWNGGTF